MVVKYNMDFSFTFHTSLGDNEIAATFNYCQIKGIPGRINAVIGYNGTGKTKLLTNLSKVARMDYHRNLPDWATTYGRISPADLQFSKVIVISFSAFDDFEIPSSLNSQENVDYIYYGLRRANDQHSESNLKEPKEIAEEITAAVLKIKMLVRQESLERALQPLREEPSFIRGCYTLDVLAKDELWYEEFNSLSSSHKISINIIVQLVADLKQKSLILINKPELHLHPTLLAALMKGITNTLESHQSYAVVVTHSPVVVQEIASQYVHVLRRHGSQNSFETPEIETFGENIGLLTRHVFNSDISQSEYVKVLHELANIYSMEELENLFMRGLSSQARALIMNAQSK